MFFSPADHAQNAVKICHNPKPLITPVKTQAKLALQEFYHFYDVDAKNRPVNGRACGLILKETDIGCAIHHSFFKRNVDLRHQVEGEKEYLTRGITIQDCAGNLALLQEGDQPIHGPPQVLGDQVLWSGSKDASGLTVGDELADEEEIFFGDFYQIGMVVFLFYNAGKCDLEQVWFVQSKAQVRTAGFDQLLQGIIRILLEDGSDGVVDVGVAFGSDGGNQGLFVGKMGVGGRVTDPGAFGNLAQAESVHAFAGEDLHAGLDEGVFQIAVMVRAGFHGWFSNIPQAAEPVEAQGGMHSCTHRPLRE